MGAFYCDDHQMQRDVNGNCWKCDDAARATAHERAQAQRHKSERLSRLLAEAERLCMEHCPNEMSAELRADWEAHQTVAPNNGISGG
jgi:hypothetical protein